MQKGLIRSVMIPPLHFLTRYGQNIGHPARIVRGICAAILLVEGATAVFHTSWLGASLLLGGVFGRFEPVRGWCLQRTCYFKGRS